MRVIFLMFLFGVFCTTFGPAKAQDDYDDYSDYFYEEDYSVHRKVHPPRTDEAYERCFNRECLKHDSRDPDPDSPYTRCGVACLGGYYRDYNEEGDE